MGYSYLLSSEASLASFRAAYNIPEDVDISYCHEGDIDIQRRWGVNTVFFPLMAILEGGVRFPVDPLIIITLRFYGLCLDQLPPNFYRIMSCISRLNQLFRLQLNHHDINFMYSLCGKITSNYYLKTKDMRVRLISCLPNLNRNLANEFVRLSGNWFADELPCSFSSHDVGRYRVYSFVNLHFLNCTYDYFDWQVTNQFLCCFLAESKRFKPGLRVVHVRDLNFVLRSKIFVH